MSKKDKEYIANLVTRVLAQVLERDCKRRFSPPGEPDRTPGEQLEMLLGRINRERTTFPEFWSEYLEDTTDLVREMKMSPEELGKIISFGLSPDSQSKGVCKETFRKTGFQHRSSEKEHGERFLVLDGPEFLLQHAVWVILAAMYDHVSVFSIIQNEGFKLEDAGLIYLERAN